MENEEQMIKNDKDGNSSWPCLLCQMSSTST